MSHPKMFADDDPYLVNLRDLAFELPGTAEKVSHGRPAFFTKKVFVYYGGSWKRDGEWVEHGTSVLVQPDESDRRALVGEERTYSPAYLGPAGWIGIILGQNTDWEEIAELLDASYRLTAPKRLVATLDGTTS